MPASRKHSGNDPHPTKRLKPSSDTRKPSEIIVELMTAIPPEQCHALIQTHLSSLIDGLPLEDTTTIVAAFSVAAEAESYRAALLQHINYEEHEASLSSQLASLEQSVRRDWHDGWEEQLEEMDYIAKEIQSWLCGLFHVAVEERTYLEDVLQALKLALKVLNRLFNVDTRISFAENDTDWKLEGASGKVFHRSNDLYELFGALSRDIICTAIVLEKDVFVNEMVEYFQGIEQQQLILDTVRTDTIDTSRDDDDDDPYQDEWYSAEMKGALPRIISLFHESDLRTFKSRPSLRLYNRILASASNLNGSLLKIVQDRLGPGTYPTIDDYHLGLEIYCKEHEWELLAALVKKLNESGSSSVASALLSERISAVRQLSMSSEEGRSMALPLLENAIKGARRAIWDALEDDCPRVEYSIHDLQLLLERRDIPQTGGNSQQQNEREALIQQYCHKTIPRHFDSDDSVDRLDKDDSDYEEQLRDLRPDLAGAFNKWSSLVPSWPDAFEKKRFEDLIEPSSEGIGEFEGLPEAIASRLDFDYNFSDSKVHLADGIRALYGLSKE